MKAAKPWGALAWACRQMEGSPQVQALPQANEMADDYHHDLEVEEGDYEVMPLC